MKLILLILAFSFNIYSQFDMDDKLKSNIFDSKLNKLNKSDLNLKEQFPSVGVVNPDFYYVGPTDLFAFNYLPIPDNDSEISIDQENNLILPRNLGKINCNNKTITQIREEIKLLVGNEKTFYFSLIKPRVCNVIIDGNIPNPNNYNFPANYRVLDVLNVILNSDDNILNEVTNKKNYSKYLEKKLKNYNQININEFIEMRNISIVNSKGESFNIDVVKNSNNDFFNNPYVDGGLKIYVPFIKKNKSLISVSGEVNKESIIYYKKGDKASDILKIAGWFTSDSDLKEVFVIYPDGSKVNLIISEDKVINDVEVVEGAKIIVNKKDKINSDFGLVKIEGEVANPGFYTIKKGETTILDVINQAGGTLDNACLNLSRIYNHNEKFTYDFETNKELIQLLQFSDLTADDTLKFNIDTKLMYPKVSANLSKVNEKNQYNILLNDGDYINIPECPNRIYVFGQVRLVGYINYQKDSNIDYYIKFAGGFTENAEKSEIRLIKGGSLTWIEIDDDTIIEPGDMIYVMAQPFDNQLYHTQRLTAYSSIATAVFSSLSFLITVYATFLR